LPQTHQTLIRLNAGGIGGVASGPPPQAGFGIRVGRQADAGSGCVHVTAGSSIPVESPDIRRDFSVAATRLGHAQGRQIRCGGQHKQRYGTGG